MKPINTNATTDVLSEPAEWNTTKDGKCIGLPVHVSSDPYVYSWWRLTLKERLLLLLGRPIQLCIVGRTHAPVALQVAAVVGNSWWLEIRRMLCRRHK
jgi:hypothetical protein